MNTQTEKTHALANKTWTNYHRAVAELGPDHPVTEQLWEAIQEQARACFFTLLQTVT